MSSRWSAFDDPILSIFQYPTARLPIWT